MKPLLIFLCAVLFSPDAWAQCDNLKPMYGDNCEKSDDMQKADEQFRQTAIKQNGSADSAANIYLRFGWRYYQDRADSAAMKRLNQAWLLNPESPEVYFAFGHLVRYAFAKNAAEAERYYKLGRDRDPKHEAEKISLVRLLNALENRNESEAGIDASTQLISRFPEYKNGIGYKKRGFYYTRMQMPKRAVDDYQKALQIDPKDPNTYVGRGYAYSWLRNHQKALADYNKAIAMDPNFVSAYTNRAILYADTLNQPNLALPDIDQALKLEPKDPAFYKIKSDILFKLSRAKEACDCLQNGIRLGNKSLVEVYEAKCKK